MKRSNSAPLIPDLVQAEVKPSPPVNSNLWSRRILSTSNVSLPCDMVIRSAFMEGSPRRQPLASPIPLSRINSPTSRQHRVEQLKKEENIDERKNEKEVQEQLMLNKNCDELRLDSEEQDFRHEQMEVWPSQPSPSHQGPLSPLTSRMIRSRSLTPTSPSSARSFSYRRSCSPVLRPSSLCFQVGRKRTRDYDSQEDMDTSPGVSCKRLQLSFPSPLNLSPSVSPLMGNSPLHHSFSTRSRKSSSTQSESTPLSSPSSLLHSTNPFAVNYDSGNCEHWQSNSGSGSNCSSAVQSPSINYFGNQRGDAMSNSPFSSKNQVVLCQDEVHGGQPYSAPSSVSNSVVCRLSPSTGIVNNDDYRGSMDSSSIEIMTEAPTPLSPKGLQFRQKLFPPQNLPSPIPRSLPYSSSVSTHSIVSIRGTLIAPPSPKSHHQHSLHHDKHLSPFKSDLSPVRMMRAVTKTRLNHLRQITDPLRTSPSASGGGTGEHVTGGCARFVPGHGAISGRQTISSPLAKLSMSSSLDDGGGSVVMGSPAKRRASETSVDSRDEILMESDNEGGALEESLEANGAGRKDYGNEVIQA